MKLRRFLIVVPMAMLNMATTCPFSFSIDMPAVPIDTTKGGTAYQLQGGIVKEIEVRLQLAAKNSPAPCDQSLATYVLANNEVPANIQGAQYQAPGQSCPERNLEQWLAENITKDADISSYVPLKPPGEKAEDSECLKSFAKDHRLTATKVVFNLRNATLNTPLPQIGVFIAPTMTAEEMHVKYPQGLDDAERDKLESEGKLVRIGESPRQEKPTNGPLEVKLGTPEQVRNFTEKLLLREGTLVVDTTSFTFGKTAAGNLIKPNGSVTIDPPTVTIKVDVSLADLGCINEFKGR